MDIDLVILTALRDNRMEMEMALRRKWCLANPDLARLLIVTVGDPSGSEASHGPDGLLNVGRWYGRERAGSR